MKSLIGHNNPPKERKVNWKSVSIDPYDYKDLQDYADNLLNKKNCFRLLNGDKPLKKISIPYAISVLITEQLHFKRILETQDNGRNIYTCLLYTSPSPRDGLLSRMPSSA